MAKFKNTTDEVRGFPTLGVSFEPNQTLECDEQTAVALRNSFGIEEVTDEQPRKKRKNESEL